MVWYFNMNVKGTWAICLDTRTPYFAQSIAVLFNLATTHTYLLFFAETGKGTLLLSSSYRFSSLKIYYAHKFSTSFIRNKRKT